ncbi:hypothetical protein SAMN05216266_12229 [Amycolatopsis marina]|uniref:Uncharacterized protein n=1 Tax=Amycolatopsis marina TaxID=490629 RepID=A0A1I1C6V0_9PSEU|nr:hypothetical protein [Amycolatopsis marina]SFB58395.1 hypothetical protein SAMN05216266_12229 [Amycolatopsis marina]
MTSGAGTGREAGGTPFGESFPEALRTAISASGLSLDRIQARLQRQGVSVSVTALSYWQSGKRQPERQSSIAAVQALEEILEIPAGSLISLLPPPRPRGTNSRKRSSLPDDGLAFAHTVLRPLLARVGAPHALEQHHQLALVSLHDRCDIAADGGQRAVTTRAVFQASTSRQDRWLLVYSQDDPAAGTPVLHAERNCTVGRVEVDADHGVTVAELLFDSAIDKGETCLIEYSVSNDGPPFPECRNTHYREFRRPVREYLLEVRFDSGIMPARCTQYSRTATAEPMRRDIRVDRTNAVHAVALDFGPGVFGIDWS